jgi:hypothetical protein
LLTFCFDGKNLCEIGVFKDSPAGHEHSLVFRKWEKVNGVCPKEPTKEYKTPTKDFELVVNKPHPDADGVFIKGRDPFDRLKPASDPEDFRWMIDFDRELYPLAHSHIVKDAAGVSPRLKMRKGIFYTHQKTVNLFNAVPSTGDPDDIKLGGSSIAMVTAARIYLDMGGSVEVHIDGTLVDTLEPTANLEYQLDVYNLCDPIAHPLCDYKPAHPTDKQKRNDFFVYYRALALPPGQPEYHLMAVLPPKKDVPIKGICQRDKEFSSDPAPCGGTGYGEETPPWG